MRKDALLIMASLAVLGGPRAHAAEEKGIRLTVLNSMERIGQGQEPYGVPKAEIAPANGEI